jgi:hypothetical protein
VLPVFADAATRHSYNAVLAPVSSDLFRFFTHYCSQHCERGHTSRSKQKRGWHDAIPGILRSNALHEMLVVAPTCPWLPQGSAGV